MPCPCGEDSNPKFPKCSGSCAPPRIGPTAFNTTPQHTACQKWDRHTRTPKVLQTGLSRGAVSRRPSWGLEDPETNCHLGRVLQRVGCHRTLRAQWCQQTREIMAKTWAENPGSVLKSAHSCALWTAPLGFFPVSLRPAAPVI